MKFTKTHIIITATLLFAAAVLGLSACGQYRSTYSKSNSSTDQVDTSGGGGIVDPGSNPNNPAPVIPNMKSAGVPILRQAYASLTSSLQVAVPSAASRTEYNNATANLSETGRPDTIGSSFALSYISLGAQLCLDRVTTEINQNANDKLLFNALALNAAPNTSVNDANLGATINRLARAIWQRNETAAERQILISAVTASMGLDAGNNANETQEAALFLCAAMVASSSGMQL